MICVGRRVGGADSPSWGGATSDRISALTALFGYNANLRSGHTDSTQAGLAQREDAFGHRASAPYPGVATRSLSARERHSLG
jgi:hypothetical protein